MFSLPVSELDFQELNQLTTLMADINFDSGGTDVGERSNFKKNPTHTQDHGDA